MSRNDDLILPVELVPDAPFSPEEVEAALAPDRPDAGHLIDSVARWRPTDDGKAEWLARLLVGARDEVAGVRAQADAWRAPIDEWEADRLASPQRVIAWAEALLAGYALEQRVDAGRSTIPLPSVRLATREVNKGGAVVVTDEDEVIAWAEEHLEGDELAAVVKVTKKVLVSGLRKVTAVVERFARDENDKTVVDDEGKPVVEVVAVSPATGEAVPGTAVEAAVYWPSIR